MYIPRSRASNNVDLPWYPPPTIKVTPLGMPMPVVVPLLGKSTVTRKDSGVEKGTTSPCVRGRGSMPLTRGRTAPSATKAINPRESNLLLKKSASSAVCMWWYNIFWSRAPKCREETICGSSSKNMVCACLPAMRLPKAGNPMTKRASTYSFVVNIDMRSKISCPGLSMDMMPLFPVPLLPLQYFLVAL